MSLIDIVDSGGTEMVFFEKLTENILGEKERINSVVSLPIGALDRINLVLVLLGEKPATSLSINALEKGARRKLKIILDVLTKIGLAYQLRKGTHYAVRKLENGILQMLYGYELIDISVSRDMQAAVRLADAWTKIGANRNPELDELSGLLYGYPQTAVNAYIGKKGFSPLDEDDLPPEIKDQECWFLTCMLSKEYWRQELEYFKHLFEILKNNAPSLIAQYNEEKRGVITQKGGCITEEEENRVRFFVKIWKKNRKIKVARF